MIPPSFDFKKQLNVGNDGEQAFLKSYTDLGPVKSRDLAVDFILSDGTKVELKTDTYDMFRTPNYFIEILGNIDDGKIGGPWRAMQDGVDYFVYQYIKNKTFIWFRTDPMCQYLDTLVSEGRLVEREIKNKTWTTRGYLVPREKLMHLEFRKDTF